MRLQGPELIGAGMDTQTVTTATSPLDPATRLAELRASAKGWHGAQLAVLGFIGLCGVLQQSSSSEPRWLQVLAGLLVLAALALACIATGLVATVAWPLDTDRAPAVPEELLHRAVSRLRTGIVLTFVAVVVLAVAATSSWWPDPKAQAAGTVVVSTDQGSVCGRLGPSQQGSLTLSTADGDVTVPLAQVVSIQPVDGC
jgi:hypothetical protein